MARWLTSVTAVLLLAGPARADEASEVMREALRAHAPAPAPPAVAPPPVAPPPAGDLRRRAHRAAVVRSEGAQEAFRLEAAARAAEDTRRGPAEAAQDGQARAAEARRDAALRKAAAEAGRGPNGGGGGNGNGGSGGGGSGKNP